MFMFAHLVILITCSIVYIIYLAMVWQSTAAPCSLLAYARAVGIKGNGAQDQNAALLVRVSNWGCVIMLWCQNMIVCCACAYQFVHACKRVWQGVCGGEYARAHALVFVCADVPAMSVRATPF
jgi:hypothetical protein